MAEPCPVCWHPAAFSESFGLGSRSIGSVLRSSLVSQQSALRSDRGQHIFWVSLAAAAGYQVHFHGRLLAGSPVSLVKWN